MTLEERFWAKVDTSASNGCWLWTGYCLKKGYGQFWSGARMTMAHRWSYELLVGPIPVGLQIDHLCKVRNCVNPAHLEAVTPAINNARSDSPTAKLARATECKFGHPLTEDNLHPCYTRMGQRRCWRCVKERQAEYRQRKRQRQRNT